MCSCDFLPKSFSYTFSMSSLCIIMLFSLFCNSFLYGIRAGKILWFLVCLLEKSVFSLSPPSFRCCHHHLHPPSPSASPLPLFRRCYQCRLPMSLIRSVGITCIAHQFSAAADFTYFARYCFSPY